MRYRIVEISEKENTLFDVVSEINANSQGVFDYLTDCHESAFILEVESESYVYFKKDECNWLEVKRRSNYELVEEEFSHYFKFYFDFYIKNNFSPSSRSCHITFSNYNEAQDFMLNQEPCEFKVELMGGNVGNITAAVEKDKFDYEIRLNSEIENHTMLYFRVIGGNRSIFINDYCFDLIEKREISDKNLEFFRPFDNGVGYTIEQERDLKIERFKKFNIDLFYVGKSNTYKYDNGTDDYVENFYYILTIRHSNDVNTRLRFKIYIPNPKDVAKEKIEETLVPNYNWIQDTNNANRTAPPPINPEMVNLYRAFVLSEERPPVISVNGIDDVSISGDTITLRTNVVNRFNDIEHDSAVVIRSTGTWCSGKDYFDYDNEMHVIKVVGTKNIYGSDRTCMLTIMNAEMSSSKKNFLVKQDKEGNIMIEEN